MEWHRPSNIAICEWTSQRANFARCFSRDAAMNAFGIRHRYGECVFHFMSTECSNSTGSALFRAYDSRFSLMYFQRAHQTLANQQGERHAETVGERTHSHEEHADRGAARAARRGQEGSPRVVPDTVALWQDLLRERLGNLPHAGVRDLRYPRKETLQICQRQDGFATCVKLIASSYRALGSFLRAGLA